MGRSINRYPESPDNELMIQTNTTENIQDQAAKQYHYRLGTTYAAHQLLMPNKYSNSGR
jgi:hypothetical protein